MVDFSRVYIQKVAKKESSCLSSNRFWRIYPESFVLQKIYLPLLVSVFEELSDEKGIFQIGVQNQLIFQKIPSLKKIRQFENFKNLSSWIQFLERISTYK